jgi:hypothetical protein
LYPFLSLSNVPSISSAIPLNIQHSTLSCVAKKR